MIKKSPFQGFSTAQLAQLAAVVGLIAHFTAPMVTDLVRKVFAKLGEPEGGR